VIFILHPPTIENYLKLSIDNCDYASGHKTKTRHLNAKKETLTLKETNIKGFLERTVNSI